MSAYAEPKRPTPYGAILTAKPVEPPQPKPPQEPGMTAADIRRYVGALDDPLVFGALQRFHNEVLPRDRPKDGVIASGADTDMWTGDVVTGGANGYFVRSYISEYLIAMSTGRTAAQASGDGYDKAIAAYMQVVNPPPPTTAPPAGPFRGPLTRDGRDFVAPA